MMMTGLC